MNKKLGDGLLKGGITIAFGGLISKILGAFYRIPLTNLLGSEGIGIYQTAFPIYCLLLTFSSTGAPSAIAKLVSSSPSSEKAVLKRALSLFAPLGAIGTALMAFLSPLISKLQGNDTAYPVYIALAPSVFLVSVISCLRGYFQGKKNMLPTATSQVVEQAVKLAVGLFLCYFFKSTPLVSATFATLAVTVSEAVALLYLIFVKRKNAVSLSGEKGFSARIIVSTVIPIAFSTLILPIARVYDSFTVVNFLKRYSVSPTSLYGVYTGGVETVIGLPVSICYGLAVATIPAVSSLMGNGEYQRATEKAGFSLFLTFGASALAGAVVYFGSDFIAEFLFGGLSETEKLLTSSLLKGSAINVVLLSLIQTETSCLISFGKNYAPCAFLGAGLLIKIAVQPFLLSNPKINIFAPLISDILCYFVAVSGNLVYIIIYKVGIAKADGRNYENHVGGNRNKSGGYFPRGVKRVKER